MSPTEPLLILARKQSNNGRRIVERGSTTGAKTCRDKQETSRARSERADHNRIEQKVQNGHNSIKYISV